MKCFMTDNDNPSDSQAFYEERPGASAICPGMELTPGLSGDEIAWQLIRLGQDCGLCAAEIAEYLLRLEGFPLWPDRESIALYLADAGL